MAEPLFALLQTSQEPIDPAVLRDVFIRDAGMPKIDAARASQKIRGILAERLTQSQAERCRASLVRQGIFTIVLPVEQLVPPSRPILVHWLGVNNDGLFVPTDYYGGGDTIPWASVFVVSSGLVKTEVEERKATEVVEHYGHHQVTSTEWKTVRKEHPQHVTEILGLNEVGQTMHFRLIAKRLHAQQVPHGGASAANFEKYLLLLDDIVAGATQAKISPQTRQILAERREVPREVEGKKDYFFDERSFAAYNRWLLTLVILEERGTAG
ncbi:MAG TPA: hypothetical protein VFB96_18415 [Pirellulaceae bacterium]|nr:hypothetical protein [Pirellulaceae bacterium]